MIGGLGYLIVLQNISEEYCGAAASAGSDLDHRAICCQSEY